ncbi:MAG: hypothetical protein IIB05_03570 [Bacteroidetes bacterium]|nr:hypothetical protein [Bacteroidota bacterium]
MFVKNYKALVEDYENLIKIYNNDSNDPSEDHLGEHYLVQQDKDNDVNDNDAKDKNTTE